MKKEIKSMYLAISALFLTTSCATIVSGGSPSIIIDGNYSKPVTITTAKATYESVTLPVEVKVRRKKLQGQRISITAENDKFKDIILEKSVNPWAFGNIMIGGLIGWGIDLGTNCVSQPAQTHFYVVPIPTEEEGK